ncbi:MAG: DUF3631 domain-containing protein [Acetobacteraceae bacterium]|nr:DUF3631 domain-containing protein [Acetobacteraceae bacterium]
MTSARQDWVDRARAVAIEHELANRGHHLRRLGGELIGPCPVCAGTDRFGVNIKNQVWNCRGCEKGGDVIALVRHIDGCEFNAAVERLAGPPPRPNGHANSQHGPSSSWIYRDAEGRPYLMVERYDSADGKKTYPQYHQEGSKWVKGKPAGPKIPYRLPELLAADPTAVVWIAEGEKCAELLAGAGLVATSASEGAGKWKDELNDHFRFRAVCIVADADEPGRKHAARVAKALHGIARDVRVLELPGLAEGEDVEQWLARGGTREELEALYAQTAAYAPPATSRARKDKEPKQAPGREIRLHVPEPWPDPVDGAELVADLEALIGSYLILPAGGAVLIALWAIHCYCYEVWPVTPRLAITSPTKQCGKTTTLDIIECLVPRPLLAANISAAAVFRVIDKAHPTLLVDEADTFLGDNDELRGVMNSGHRYDGRVVRCVGDDGDPREFNTFAPLAVALIGMLHETLHDRSIVCRLFRRKASEWVKSFRRDRADLLLLAARKIARWVADHLEALKCADPDMGALTNRTADNWRPLFAIADELGGEWPARVRAVAGNGTDEESIYVELLRDVRTVIGERDRITSEELVAGLVAMEERPWSEFNGGKPITKSRLARLLGRFPVTSATIRVGERTAKGYYRAAFDDWFERYLAPTPP